MNISMGAFGNTGPGLGARGWGTASDMARHRVLASLCMGKGKKKSKILGGRPTAVGRRKRELEKEQMERQRNQKSAESRDSQLLQGI